ncbi:MAG: DUF1592 domain-containing protein [Myxococcota bacterium]
MGMALPLPAVMNHITRLTVLGILLAGCQGSIGSVGTEAPEEIRDNDEPPPPPVVVGEDGCEVPRARIWKLTPPQLDRAVAGLVPGAEPVAEQLRGTLTVTSGRFSNEAARLDMAQQHVSQLFQLASDLADRILSGAGDYPLCTGADPERSCAETFVATFAPKAFRRPVTTEDSETLLRLYDAQAAEFGGEVAFRQLIRAILMSPDFLYRTELGEGGGGAMRLTSYETASALSFFITDGPPDAALLDAAASGALDSVEGVEAETRRLLERPEGATGLLRFFGEFLHTEAAADVPKNREVLPLWNNDVGKDMVAETDRFVQAVLWEEDATIRTLLTADFGFVNERLAPIYGVEGVTGTDLRRVTFPAGERSGVLTHGAFLAVEAREEESDLVFRGKYLRTILLCEPVPDPPPDVNAVPPPPDGVFTQRERLEQSHTTDPSCAACHRLLDPLGYPFEHYDAIGAYRTMEAGKPIDPTGEFIVSNGTATADDDASFPFNDVHGLAEILVEHDQFRDCFVERTYEYARGQMEEAVDRCAVDGARRRLDESGGNILEAVVAITTHDAFITRNGL